MHSSVDELMKLWRRLRNYSDIRNVFWHHKLNWLKLTFIIKFSLKTQKILLIGLALAAIAYADVSHLAQKDGYHYPKPEQPFEETHQITEVIPPPTAAPKYLPPPPPTAAPPPPPVSIVHQFSRCNGHKFAELDFRAQRNFDMRFKGRLQPKGVLLYSV